ncbi:hypothetical protein M9H77_26933 [Catharanthus roseus]|uniref:Uncharacterized protein n=1 Tax=Catharanthus roseus TaxID=4058 RepID=A0ACC0ACM8_CATRO|nr:hypothetical protein M9H77_26933 [Catharanthus roseus]
MEEEYVLKWARKKALIVNTYLIITRYLSKRRFDRRPYVTLVCKRGERRKKKVRLDDDDEDEEEEVLVKRRGPHGMKKCNCPFQLKKEKSTTENNWKLYISDGRHNHKICVYLHAHAQVARLMDDQLKLTEEFCRCQVAHRNIMMVSLLERNMDCTVSKQTIYNAQAKMKKKRMEGRNMVEEVIHRCN